MRLTHDDILAGLVLVLVTLSLTMLVVVVFVTSQRQADVLPVVCINRVCSYHEQVTP